MWWVLNSNFVLTSVSRKNHKAQKWYQTTSNGEGDYEMFGSISFKVNSAVFLICLEVFYDSRNVAIFCFKNLNEILQCEKNL